MFTPSDTIITITHSRSHTITTTTTPQTGPDVIAILTLVLPLITFAAGYFINLYFENRKERHRLRDVKQYFLTLATFLSKVLEGQATIIQDATAMVQLMVDTNIAVGIYPELNTTRIKAIPDLDLYKVFIANKDALEDSTRMLLTLSSGLDSIDSIKSRLEQANADLVKEIMLYIERFTIAYDAIGTENAQIVKTSPSHRVIKDMKLLELHMIYAECSREFAAKVKSENLSGSNITKRYEYLIKPLFEKTRNIEELESTYNMLNSIAKLNYDYKNFLIVKQMAVDILNGLTTD